MKFKDFIKLLLNKTEKIKHEENTPAKDLVRVEPDIDTVIEPLVESREEYTTEPEDEPNIDSITEPIAELGAKHIVDSVTGVDAKRTDIRNPIEHEEKIFSNSLNYRKLENYKPRKHNRKSFISYSNRKLLLTQEREELKYKCMRTRYVIEHPQHYNFNYKLYDKLRNSEKKIERINKELEELEKMQNEEYWSNPLIEIRETAWATEKEEKENNVHKVNFLRGKHCHFFSWGYCNKYDFYCGSFCKTYDCTLDERRIEEYKITNPYNDEFDETATNGIVSFFCNFYNNYEDFDFENYCDYDFADYSKYKNCENFNYENFEDIIDYCEYLYEHSCI